MLLRTVITYPDCQVTTSISITITFACCFRQNVWAMFTNFNVPAVNDYVAGSESTFLC
jgi:hypothetical protein